MRKRFQSFFSLLPPVFHIERLDWSGRATDQIRCLLNNVQHQFQQITVVINFVSKSLKFPNVNDSRRDIATEAAHEKRTKTPTFVTV
jgi:hypothetical protein